MRALTEKEKIKIKRFISIYDDHINLTSIPTVLFYYYNKGTDIMEETNTAKDYYLQNCKTREYIETLFLLNMLEENGLIYIDKDRNTTKKEYIADIEKAAEFGDTESKRLLHTIVPLPEETGRTIARHYYSNTYINQGLIALYESGFKTIEEKELECTRLGLRRNKFANGALWATLIVTIIGQGAIILYNYHFNSQIPTKIEITNMPTKQQIEKTNDEVAPINKSRKNINIKADEAQISLDSSNCDISIRKITIK